MPMRILVPLERHFGLDSTLPIAGDLARARGAVVRLLHVTASPFPRTRAGEPVRPAFDADAAARDEAKAFLAAARAALPGVTVETSVRCGQAADEILAEAREVGADLVVMSTRGRRPVEGALVGSVAQTVMRLCERPVLLVKA